MTCLIALRYISICARYDRFSGTVWIEDGGNYMSVVDQFDR